MITLDFPMQHADQFSTRVCNLCLPLFLSVNTALIQSVRLSQFTTEDIINATCRFSQMEELVIAGCRFVRGDSLLQLQTEKLQSLNFTYSDQIKGQEILACVTRNKNLRRLKIDGEQIQQVHLRQIIDGMESITELAIGFTQEFDDTILAVLKRKIEYS